MTPEAIEHAAKRNRALRSGMIARLRPMLEPAKQVARQLRSVANGVESIRIIVKQVESCKHVPGFFPTPCHLVARMIEEAGDLTGKTVLEPSAGNGAIAKEARKVGAIVSCVEYNCTLASILRQDGFEVENGDFMETQPKPFDFVLMNPPFERGADALHVMHAFKFVREGGKLIAIMGEGSFYRSDRAAIEFRNWLETVGGISERLPEGTFSGADAYRPTGVQTRMVIIDA